MSSWVIRYSSFGSGFLLPSSVLFSEEVGDRVRPFARGISPSDLAEETNLAIVSVPIYSNNGKLHENRKDW